jgi:bifunctional ADP-heptose synthase (sugar kinase/adenylyltransferase)
MFGEDTPLELLKIIRPNILVKGGDYQVETIVGYDLVTSYGGKVITLPLVKGYSTTTIIKKISSGNL